MSPPGASIPQHQTFQHSILSNVLYTVGHQSNMAIRFLLLDLFLSGHSAFNHCSQQVVTPYYVSYPTFSVAF